MSEISGISLASNKTWTDPQQLPMEPSLPFLRLGDFRGGSQLPHLSCPTLEQLHREPVAQLLFEQLERHEQTDLQVCVGTRTFNCQRLLLNCHLDYFRDKQTKEMVELPADRITPAAFELVYNWIRQPSPVIEREHIVELLEAAEYFKLQELSAQIWSALNQRIVIVEADAFRLALEATRYAGYEQLQQLMYQRISRFFLTLVASKEYVDLPIEMVTCLLNSTNLGINSEKEIFYSALRWLEHDWPARQKQLPEIKRCIRWTLLPKEFLEKLKKPTDNVIIDALSQTPEFQNELLEFTFAQQLYGYVAGNLSIAEIFASFGIQTEFFRKFIYDARCSYHQKDSKTSPLSFSYVEFLDYLSLLQSTAAANGWLNLEIEPLKPGKPTGSQDNL